MEESKHSTSFQERVETSPANYRPVSLNLVACKVLEHIIPSNSMRHFDQNNILTVKQHGFGKRRPCVTQFSTTMRNPSSLEKVQGRALVRQAENFTRSSGVWWKQTLVILYGPMTSAPEDTNGSTNQLPQ